MLDNRLQYIPWCLTIIIHNLYDFLSIRRQSTKFDLSMLFGFGIFILVAVVTAIHNPSIYDQGAKH